MFVDAILEHAKNHRQSNSLSPIPEKDIRRLQMSHEGIAMVSEIFAILSRSDRNRAAHLRSILEAHNFSVKQGIGSQGRGVGMPAKRLEAAGFSEQQISFTLRLSTDEKVAVDQRTLCKLLATVMSFESCRSLIVLLSDVGLLHREDIGNILITSPGHLETYYSNYLRTIADGLERTQETA